jgi:cytochrome c peroxidase
MACALLFGLATKERRRSMVVRNKSLFVVVVAGALALGGGGCVDEVPAEGLAESELSHDRLLDELYRELPNSLPIANARGFAASFSTAGSVDLDNAFFTPQGTNGRHCGTCHRPEDGWSINGPTVTELFLRTDGLHPIFASNIDTDTPSAKMDTVEQRWDATTMLRQGLFTRQVKPPVNRDYDVTAAVDPFGVGTTESLFWFRRPMPTASFISHNVNWDGSNTVGTSLIEGLKKQVRGNIPAAQEGPPPSEAIVQEIADYELGIAHAQIIVPGVGRLDADGARGGPAHAAAQALAEGRFDLFDAWEHSDNPRRRQIWRGQQVFNGVGTNRSCGGCHNAANNGQHVRGVFFDIKTSRPDLAPGRAVYTFKSRVTGTVVESTDPGQGIRDGQFAHLNKFKVPNLRGLVSHAPYFHNGIAPDLMAVVRHYEKELGFVYTAEQRADLVAFLEAL